LCSSDDAEIRHLGLPFLPCSARRERV
jgi:hypothetical protein